MLSKKNALKWLLGFIAAEMLFIALFTYLMDPFYQYHEPYFGLQAVLNDRDNQVAGSIRTLPYDSILLGSSVVENCDSSFLDAAYGCHTLKIVKGSGSTADLLYYLRQAHERQELHYVFWGMDIAALCAPTEVTLYGDDIPRYLHTETVLDDFPYLFNKDILFMKIPTMVAYSYLDINTGGNAYDWSRWKDFYAEKAMLAYTKPDEVLPSSLSEEQKQLVSENIAMVVEEIKSHPETQYTLFFPPYSLLWWDFGYTNGLADTYFYTLEHALPALLSCENATVYYFQAERDIVCNLDNYMDTLHYSPQINQYMLDCMVSGTHQVTQENADAVLADMKATYEYIIQESIYEYYPKNNGE